MKDENKVIEKIISHVRKDGRVTLSDQESFQIMETIGIPLADYRFIKGLNWSELKNKAHEVGYPLALKMVSKGLLHKTEAGGVFTDIAATDSLKDAFNKIKKINVEGLLLQRMVKGEVELIIGAKFDPFFGGVVMFGLGGKWVEVMKDISLRLAPVRPQEALAMIKETRIAPVLFEFRGREALAVDKLSEIIVKISHLISSFGIKEIDLNPVILNKEEAKCVDVKMVLREEDETEKFHKLRGKVELGKGLHHIFNPESVLVVGSSVLKEKVGMTKPSAFENIVYNMKKFFKGEVSVLDIKEGGEERIKKMCRAFSEKEMRFDLGIFLLPPKECLYLLKNLKNHLKSMVHLSAAPPQDTPQRQEYLNIVKSVPELRLIGANSILGVIDTESGVNTTFERDLMPERGNIAVLSQSGGVGAALLDWAVFNKIGISKFVFMGDKVDVNDSDMLKLLKDDRKTKVIAIYMEGMDEGRGREFVTTAREVVKEKPIVVLKGARTEESARRAKSHTAATAGKNEVFNCAFYEAGIIRVSNIESLFSTALTLSLQPPMKGRSVAVVSNVGGPAILAADALADQGLLLSPLSEETKEKIKAKYPAIEPINPLDLIADADEQRYGFVLDAVLQDENVDGVLIIDMMKSTYFKPEYVRVFKELSQKYHKPLVNVVPGGEDFKRIAEELRDTAIPCFNTPEKGAEALRSLYLYHIYRKRIEEAPF